jgi:hypothetical protein
MSNDGFAPNEDLLSASEKAVEELSSVSKALSRGAEVSQSEDIKNIADKTSKAAQEAVDLKLSHSFNNDLSLGLSLGGGSYNSDDESSDSSKE